MISTRMRARRAAPAPPARTRAGGAYRCSTIDVVASAVSPSSSNDASRSPSMIAPAATWRSMHSEVRNPKQLTRDPSRVARAHSHSPLPPRGPRAPRLPPRRAQRRVPFLTPRPPRRAAPGRSLPRRPQSPCPALSPSSSHFVQSLPPPTHPRSRTHSAKSAAAAPLDTMTAAPDRIFARRMLSCTDLSTCAASSGARFAMCARSAPAPLRKGVAR